jgi:hypothetical protein
MIQASFPNLSFLYALVLVLAIHSTCIRAIPVSKQITGAMMLKEQIGEELPAAVTRPPCSVSASTLHINFNDGDLSVSEERAISQRIVQLASKLAGNTANLALFSMSTLHGNIETEDKNPHPDEEIVDETPTILDKGSATVDAERTAEIRMKFHGLANVRLGEQIKSAISNDMSILSGRTLVDMYMEDDLDCNETPDPTHAPTGCSVSTSTLRVTFKPDSVSSSGTLTKSVTDLAAEISLTPQLYEMTSFTTDGLFNLELKFHGAASISLGRVLLSSLSSSEELHARHKTLKIMMADDFDCPHKRPSEAQLWPCKPTSSWLHIVFNVEEAEPMEKFLAAIQAIAKEEGLTERTFSLRTDENGHLFSTWIHFVGNEGMRRGHQLERRLKKDLDVLHKHGLVQLSMTDDCASLAPTFNPTPVPTRTPTFPPTPTPTSRPTEVPTDPPTRTPTMLPSHVTAAPTQQETHNDPWVKKAKSKTNSKHQPVKKAQLRAGTKLQPERKSSHFDDPWVKKASIPEHATTHALGRSKDGAEPGFVDETRRHVQKRTQAAASMAAKSGYTKYGGSFDGSVRVQGVPVEVHSDFVQRDGQ